MRKLMIIGAGSGVGLTLAKSLLDTHELWTTSHQSEVELPTHHFRWNAEHVTSGVYILHLQTDLGSQSKKVVVLR